jgi:23S rRNA pseudouridine2605 synthase
MTPDVPTRTAKRKPVIKQGASAHPGERLAKRMAGAGLCSRREAERLIADGLVKVNGVVVTTPAINVTTNDKIVVRGKTVEAPQTLRLFLFHKPRDMVVSRHDEQGRLTVFDGLPADLPRLISVGRLDVNSEGLLLLVTQGALARYLELPSTGLDRTYRVRVFGTLTAVELERAQRGLTIEGVRYGPITITPERLASGQNQWLRVSLREGKNREIRKVMAHFGLAVNRLVRLSYGPFELGDLPRGALVEVPTGRLKRLLPSFFATRPA